jgi:hypothetical protein
VNSISGFLEAETWVRLLVVLACPFESACTCICLTHLPLHSECYKMTFHSGKWEYAVTLLNELRSVLELNYGKL